MARDQLDGRCSNPLCGTRARRLAAKRCTCRQFLNLASASSRGVISLTAILTRQESHVEEDAKEACGESVMSSHLQLRERGPLCGLPGAGCSMSKTHGKED